MSTKRPNDMKNAFQALRVNQPLRLPKTGPALSPPNEAPRNEVPSVEMPPDGASRSEEAQSERTRNEVAPSGAPPFELPRDEAARGLPPAAKSLNKLSQDEAPRPGVPHFGAAPSGGARNEAAPSGVPRFEVAQNEEAGSGEPGGFFKLSHTLFADPRIQQMSGDCFRLFLWLSMRAWRFPDSTGVVRASVRFVEEATGMGHATISRALKVLKDHELVEALEVDYKRGNVWKIARLALPGGAPDPKPRKKLTHKELPQSEAPFFSTEAPSNRARTRLEMSAQVPQNEDQYKKYKNLKKHSQDALGVFFDRLAKIGAPRKRETELSSLDSLLATFSPEQIEAALNHVEAKGTLKGERCHSPFTYLSLAMDDVLRRLQPTKHATAAPAIPSNDDADAEQRRAALAIFESELSTETQESFIARYTESEYLHGFVPPPTVVRSFAAAAWFAARLSGGKITLFAQPFEARHEADNRIPVVVRVIDWNDRLRLEPGSCDAQRVQDG